MASLIVNTGRAIATARIIASALFLGWGTGAGTTGATDTALFTEATEARVNATLTQQTVTTTNDTVQAVATMTCAGASKTITNFGLFDASTAGNLYVKLDAPGAGYTLNVGDSLALTMKITYS